MYLVITGSFDDFNNVIFVAIVGVATYNGLPHFVNVDVVVGCHFGVATTEKVSRWGQSELRDNLSRKIHMIVN